MDFRAWALALLAGMALVGCDRGGLAGPPEPSGAVMGASGSGATQPGTGPNGRLGGSSGLGMTGSFPAGTSTQAAGPGSSNHTSDRPARR